jgi:phenylacetate-coenzyme A ligase PaaK-like adenylate-forming protein
MSLEDRLYPLLRVYEKLPKGLQGALGFTYRHLPQTWRWGKHYPEFKRLAVEGEQWSPDQIREYQLKELRRTLHHAASYCRFYQFSFTQARFRPESVHTFADLRDCPFLDKTTLLERLPDMVAADVPPKERLYITTGGSTGVPVGFYLQKGIGRPKEQAFWETIWRRGGYFDGARLAVIRGHVVSSEAEGKIAAYDATRDWLMLSSYHLTETRLPEYLEAIEAFKPDLLHAYPSAALQLAEYLEKSGQAWRAPLRGLLCGSERLTLPQKRLLERVFHCRAYRWYGHSERIVLAGEGRDSELFYFVPQYGFVEFGPPTEDGLREVIGTSFHNMAMPLVRYRTGDYVRLVEASVVRGPWSPVIEYRRQDAAQEPDTLEFPWPAVSEVAGREQEFLVSATGRRISLTAFNMHDAIFDDLYAVQFFQAEPGRAEFRYIPGPQFRSSRLPQIEAAIRAKLGDDFQIEFKAVAEVEKTARGKHRWLVGSLAGAAPGAAKPNPELPGSG